MSAAALPQEIFMMFIDQVYLANMEHEEANRQHDANKQHRRSAGLPTGPKLQDRKMPFNWTLAACALVCRSWLQRSRFLQFDSDWGSKGIYLDLLYQHRELSELASLLQSPLCTISPHVQKLELDSLSYGSRSDLMHLKTLSNLTYIALADVSSDDEVSDPANYMQSKDIPAFLACFEQTRSLDLSRFMLESFEDLRYIICSCPRLHYLHLWDVQAEERGAVKHLARGSSSSILQPPRSLRVLTLFIRGSFGDELLDWLATSAPAAPLEKVELDAQVLMDYPAGGRLLESLGTNLRDLVIDTMLIDEYDDGQVYRLNDTVDLGRNTGLRKLSFRGVAADGSDKIVPAVLDQVRACNMEEIRIELSRLNRVDAQTIRWQEIDAILARPNFAQLGGLYITISNTVDDLSQDWFYDTFPRSLSRGIAHLLEPDC